MKAHIIWDWNGTLLNDFSVSLNATNTALSDINIPKISSAFYRDNYCVPVDDFYEKIIGRAVTQKERKRIGRSFNENYKPEVIKAPLAKKALDILSDIDSQSICSLMENNLLLTMVENFGIKNHFSLIQGRKQPFIKEGKEKHLKSHLDYLTNQLKIDKNIIVLVGDTEDDAYSAISSGIHSVLYSGGTYSYERLATTGKPVATTLREAIHLAENCILGDVYV